MSRARMSWATIMILVVFSACVEEQLDPEEDFAFEIIDDGNAVKITGYVGTNTEVRIPRRIQGLPVTTIGPSAFSDGEWGYGSFVEADHQFTSITIPNSVTHIGREAFRGNRLTHVTIPASVVYMGWGAFCSAQLSSLTLSDGITHIWDAAFCCNQLTGIAIPRSVTHIGNEAFAENQLANIVIPDSVTHIGNHAFTDNQLVNIVIPDNVTHIGSFAFVNNQLVSVVIGNGVTHIGGGAFRGSRWDAENGEWLDGRGNLTNVTIGNGVSHIGRDAFMDNQIANIVISDNVTIIGNRAFKNNQITSAIIPSNISIGWGAFMGNPLANIALGSNVELHERYLVFDNDIHRFLRSNNVRAGTYTHSNGRWSFSLPELPAIPGNSLANTVWENPEIDAIIRFGETSFSFTNVDRRGHSSSLAGSYTINGDLVTLNFGAGVGKALGAEEIMGAIAGNLMTLTMFGEFARIQ